MPTLKKSQLNQRIKRVRSRISGSGKRPRLCVFISNRHVTAQLINDSEGVTLAYSTTVKYKSDDALIKKAQWVGQDIAKKAKELKVTQVVFDRHGHRYHGRLKAMAEAARTEGLEF